MKFKVPFGPTLDQIHDALVSGFQKFRLSNGKFLTATNTNNTTPSGGTYPFLAFRTGRFSLKPWKDFQWSLSWDIPATLTVQGPGEDGEIQARQVLNDLILRTMQLIGLPIDDKGKVTPLNDNTIRLFDEGKLTFLCERGAPFLTSGNVSAIDDGLCRAELVFHVESTMSFDQRELNLMKVGVLGINPVPPDGIFQDSTTDDGRGVHLVYGTSDESGFGGYASKDPALPQGFINSNQEKPDSNVEPTQSVTAQVIVQPYSLALSIGTPTAQLSAIAQSQSYITQYVTSSGAWQSSAPSVATVSASGLVSRVAAGSCTVSCTFNGVVSNAVAVTCS
jgi:hypothetical protein